MTRLELACEELAKAHAVELAAVEAMSSILIEDTELKKRKSLALMALDAAKAAFMSARAEVVLAALESVRT